MKPIKEIRIYDPKTEGYDGRSYNALIKRDVSQAINLEHRWFGKVCNSKVEGNKTLLEFLYGTKKDTGYLHKLFTPNQIAFANGKLYSTNSRQINKSSFIEEVIEKENAVPFVFHKEFVNYKKDYRNSIKLKRRANLQKQILNMLVWRK